MARFRTELAIDGDPTVICRGTRGGAGLAEARAPSSSDGGAAKPASSILPRGLPARCNLPPPASPSRRSFVQPDGDARGQRLPPRLARGNAGDTNKEVQVAGGWKATRMVDEVYGHLEQSRVESAVLNAAKGLGNSV